MPPAVRMGYNRPKLNEVSVGKMTRGYKNRSHPEMVGDMSRVTLNFDLSKIYFVHF